MTSASEFEQVHSQLETVTKNLDDELHELLKGEKREEKTLKEELQENEELMEMTNKGLQILEGLEEVEEKVDRYEAGHEDGVNQETIEKLIGTERSELLRDLKDLKRIAGDLQHRLSNFKEDADGVEQNLNNFNEIENKVEESLNKTEELQDRLSKMS